LKTEKNTYNRYKGAKTPPCICLMGRKRRWCCWLHRGGIFLWWGKACWSRT